MEEKTITLYPATIDNKNIVEDWIDDFMRGTDNFIDLSKGSDKRLIGCPFGDGNVIECCYTFGHNTITFRAYGEKDRFNEELFLTEVVAPLLEQDIYVKLDYGTNDFHGVKMTLYY